MIAMFLDLPGARLAELPRRQRAAERRRASRRAPPRPSRCCCSSAPCGKSRPAAAVPLAARRDGRPDAGVGAHPRRHDGHRRRVPDGAGQPGPARSAPGRRTVIAIVGAVTALFAATIAVAQNDIKRVLAYSTVSQLGYMFLAVGSGAYVAAIFHMITHAFFKALLFLGSGSVIHGMHDEQDMRKHGRAAQAACRSRRSRSSSAGWPSPACRRSPASGRRTRSSSSPATRAQLLWARRPGHRAAHRLLHDPPGDHGLLRRGPLGGGRPEPVSTAAVGDGRPRAADAERRRPTPTTRRATTTPAMTCTRTSRRGSCWSRSSCSPCCRIVRRRHQPAVRRGGSTSSTGSSRWFAGGQRTSSEQQRGHQVGRCSAVATGAARCVGIVARASLVYERNRIKAVEPSCPRPRLVLRRGGHARSWAARAGRRFEGVTVGFDAQHRSTARSTASASGPRASASGCGRAADAATCATTRSASASARSSLLGLVRRPRGCS